MGGKREGEGEGEREGMASSFSQCSSGTWGVPAPSLAIICACGETCDPAHPPHPAASFRARPACPPHPHPQPPQGRIVPCEFIGVVKSQQSVYLKGELVSNHDELMCNFFAQVGAGGGGVVKWWELVGAGGGWWRCGGWQGDGGLIVHPGGVVVGC